jgi:hypothetical protein
MDTQAPWAELPNFGKERCLFMLFTTPTKVALSCFGLLVGLWQFHVGLWSNKFPCLPAVTFTIILAKFTMVSQPIDLD